MELPVWVPLIKQVVALCAATVARARYAPDAAEEATEVHAAD